MSISIIQPVACVNLIENPSFEIGVAHWTALYSAELSRSSDYAYFGVSSMRARYGMAQADHAALTAGKTYVLSFYCRWADGTALTSHYIEPIDVGDCEVYEGDILCVPVGDGWYRVQTPPCTVGADGAVAISLNQTSGGPYLYIDGVQLEEASAPTTYCDGTQPGCTWNGAAHASASTRSAMVRAGGLAVDLADYMLVRDMLGVGAAQFKNVSSTLGLAGGALWQRSVKQMRAFSIIGAIEGTSVANLHLLQRQLFDLLKPDLVVPPQPLSLIYRADDDTTGKALRIRAVYDGGLEFESQVGRVMEKVALRFVAHDPLWYEENDSAAILGFTQTIAATNYILQRTTGGTWQALGSGLNSYPTWMIQGPDGCLYAGGAFTTAGGTTVNYVAKWNGTSWSALDSGLAATSLAGAFDQAGNLYVLHTDSTGGYISKWNGSSWSALGAGLGAVSFGSYGGIAVGNDGSIYVGGLFTTAGGSSASNVAKWDGSSWSALGAGTDDRVYCCVIGPDGCLYVGGEFTDAGGTTCNGVAKWNGTTWSALGGGMGGLTHVICLAFGLDGALYAGGVFTSAGGISCSNIARWNGVTWNALGDGLNAGCYTIQVETSGLIRVTGAFTQAGGLTTSYVATWNGSAWVRSDATLASYIYSGCVGALGVFVGTDVSGSGSSVTSIITTVNNGGSAAAYPRITFTGPGSVVQLVNYTTGDSLWFNLSLAAGESAVLDLSPGRISFTSSFRGNIIGTILPGSNLATWRLLPGLNALSCFVTGSTAATGVAMVLKNAHWSVDGVQ